MDDSVTKPEQIEQKYSRLCRMLSMPYGESSGRISVEGLERVIRVPRTPRPKVSVYVIDSIIMVSRSKSRDGVIIISKIRT